MTVARDLVAVSAGYGDNPIVRAVVSVFSISGGGQAVQLGSAITDESGLYEMYISPPPP